MIRSFLTVSVGTFTSRLLGFARDSMIAALLGTGAVADAFLVAFQLVNVVRRLLAEGALSGTSFATPIVTALAAVAYQDSGLDRAVKARQTPLNPKSMMLAHLLGKNQTKKLDSNYGYGLIRAPAPPFSIWTKMVNRTLSCS